MGGNFPIVSKFSLIVAWFPDRGGETCARISLEATTLNLAWKEGSVIWSELVEKWGVGGDGLDG